MFKRFIEAIRNIKNARLYDSGYKCAYHILLKEDFTPEQFLKFINENVKYKDSFKAGMIQAACDWDERNQKTSA